MEGQIGPLELTHVAGILGVSLALSVMALLGCYIQSLEQYNLGYEAGFEEGNKTGYEAGYDDGYQVGYAEGNESLRECLNKLRGCRSDLSKANDTLDECEKNLDDCSKEVNKTIPFNRFLEEYKIITSGFIATICQSNPVTTFAIHYSYTSIIVLFFSIPVYIGVKFIFKGEIEIESDLAVAFLILFISLILLFGILAVG